MLEDCKGVTNLSWFHTLSEALDHSIFERVEVGGEKSVLLRTKGNLTKIFRKGKVVVMD